MLIINNNTKIVVDRDDSMEEKYDKRRRDISSTSKSTALFTWEAFENLDYII